jgi:hypothetical protein
MVELENLDEYIIVEAIHDKDVDEDDYFDVIEFFVEQLLLVDSK